jgi:alkylation response protein AidB-like acyl-CoA dehydrogenase
MDLQLSEDQELFRATTRRFVEDRTPVGAARLLRESAVPEECGGAGLTLAHQTAWAEVVRDYRVPVNLFVSIGMLGITLLDHGSEDLKRVHLPRILRGEEIWVQLLSEPSGGSDMAGALTRATRDGDSWVLNGAKAWTTGADLADFGMCLARTDWNAPKAQGSVNVCRAIAGRAGQGRTDHRQ